MVRAGVVKHPSEWPFCGYHEIQKIKERYAIIDYKGLKKAYGFGEIKEFAESYRGWVDEVLKKVKYHHDPKWTESIAVGSELFVNEAKELLGAEGRGRKVRERDGVFELREDTTPYNGILEHENVALSPTNCNSWSGY